MGRAQMKRRSCCLWTGFYVCQESHPKRPLTDLGSTVCFLKSNGRGIGLPGLALACPGQERG